MLKSKIESLLFIATKPLSLKKLGELVGVPANEVEVAAEELMEDYNIKDRGIRISRVGDKFQMVSSPVNRKLVQDFLKDEMTGELTRPQLETLTVIAYRGPISKAELEQIRGVNCSLILRNLMIRGLAESYEDKKKMQTYYTITFDFLRYLGVNDVRELPDYERLHTSDVLEKLLESLKEKEIEPEIGHNAD